MKQTTQSGVGTSFHSVTFKATVNELRGILGKPTCDENTGDDKINFEWVMETESGEVFTVYDWKEYRVISENEEIEWHIGGKNEAVTITAREEIKTALKEFYEPLQPDFATLQRLYDAARTREESLTAEVTRLRSLINEFADKIKGV